MKPAPLEYVAANTPEEAVQLLGSGDTEAKVLAGGQSLVPMLNMRLARPALVVDIGRLNLRKIAHRPSEIGIGALVSHRTIETSKGVMRTVPMLPRAAQYIGHPAIRNRGTIGGSIAHADPTAEMSLVSVVLDAKIRVLGTRGMRELTAEAFFTSAFTTLLEDDEMILEVAIPRPSLGERHGFAEVSRRSGDFALAAAACVLPSSGTEDGRVRIALAGAGPKPVRLPMLERAVAEDESSISVEFAEEAIEDLGVAVLSAHRRHVLAVALADAIASAITHRGVEKGSEH